MDSAGCAQNVFFSNMGKQAAISHTKGMKHQQFGRVTHIEPPVTLTAAAKAPDGALPLSLREQILIDCEEEIRSPETNRTAAQQLRGFSLVFVF